MAESSNIESVLTENRVFEPPTAQAVGAKKWLIGSMDEYRAMHARSIADPQGFWAEAADELHWFERWDRVLDWALPDARWFVGGKTNLCYNCVDRQVDQGFGDQAAIIWEGESVGPTGPETRTLSYADLQRETAKLANAMQDLGVGMGDVVTIYMGMVPELAIACLACVRIGAVHSVIFGGFSAQAIADRVADDGRLVGVGSFAAMCSGFDELLGVVPRSAGIGHEDRQADSGAQGPHQQPHEIGRASCRERV